MEFIGDLCNNLLISRSLVVSCVPDWFFFSVNFWIFCFFFLVLNNISIEYLKKNILDAFAIKIKFQILQKKICSLCLAHSVSFYKDYCYQRTAKEVKFEEIGEFILNFFSSFYSFYFLDFVTFFLHPHGDLFSWPLCRLHHQKKFQNSQFFFWKLNILFFRNKLAGPVNLVKLA